MEFINLDLETKDNGRLEFHIKGLPSVNVTRGFYDGYISYIRDWQQLSLTKDPSALFAMAAGLSLQKANPLLSVDKDQLVMFSLAEKDKKSLVRGIVEERRSATIAAVYLIDYGFRMNVNIRLLSHLPNAFRNAPPLSFPITLTDADRIPPMHPSAFEDLRFVRVTAKITGAGNNEFLVKSLTAFTPSTHEGIDMREAVKLGTRLERVMLSVDAARGTTTTEFGEIENEEELRHRSVVGLSVGWAISFLIMLLIVLVCFLVWSMMKAVDRHAVEGQQQRDREVARQEPAVRRPPPQDVRTHEFVYER
ncbi:hypothetical protein WR25_10246 [Diploscapter pachys]|uniref:Tudor domain-containing protein n=1 Tax=Diploscapter pachys TaxID=2018661 RepID=A0A2A2KD48_9BILA|nr:hypothetical protein WR25_10246 [Diploscapter pachys]